MRDGLLLINLGSPEQPSTSAVRGYLRTFLMDRHVMDVHWTLRALLVYGLIAPMRAPKSARAYQSIWSNQGSPLRHFSERFASEVTARLSDVHVEFAMRYGRPSIRAALTKLRQAGVENLRVIPLYPQFAKSSSLTAVEAVLHELGLLGWQPQIRFLPDFYDRSEWISALAENIRRRNEGFDADFLMMSYHGLPEHHVREAGSANCLVDRDCCAAVSTGNRLCYRAQCFATSRALTKACDWPDRRSIVSFQSRLGRRPWIKPYSDIEIVELAKRGVKRVLVSCPSFVADCLETLEEIGIRMKRDFLAAGGEDLRLVPAVNDSADWVAGFCRMVVDPRLAWWSDAEAAQTLTRVGKR